MDIESAKEQNTKKALDDDLFVYVEGNEPGSKGRKSFEEAIEYITSRPTENFKVYYKTSSTARKIQSKSKAYLVQYIPWAHKIEFEKNRAHARIKSSTRLELAKLRQLMPNP